MIRKIVLQKWRVFPFFIYEGKWELKQKLNTEKNYDISNTKIN